MKTITICKGIVSQENKAKDEQIITFEQLRRMIKSGEIVRHIFRYDKARLLTCNLDAVAKPFLCALIMRMLSRGVCCIEDETGRYEKITLKCLAEKFMLLIGEYAQLGKLLRNTSKRVDELRRARLDKSRNALSLLGRPVYLRTDLWLGGRAGGSVGHISGVLNNLDEFSGKPLFLTSGLIPTVRRDVETHVVAVGRKYYDFFEVPSIYYNRTFIEYAEKVLSREKISFIYQRYSVYNYCGVELSRTLKVPFVLEYNGSEIWINKNWGNPLKYEQLAEKIEYLNLHAADVVVVISKPLKDELVRRGIEAEKILVNPNGVNPECYSPEIDGSGVRSALGLDGSIVVGFIGTFGKWHGAEVLAEAFGRLMAENFQYRGKVRLLMIGNGLTMHDVKANIERHKVTNECVFTGIVPQEEGPAHLAACDILASPHVPNTDGTPFFGSPTKLFEYMAMGKGIVASELDQIGEILEHNRTAWMVKPGDAEILKEGIKVLIENKELRERLGKAARREVVSKYAWKEHTRRIIDKLKERVG